MIDNSSTTAIHGHTSDFLNAEERLVLTLLLSILILLGIFTNALVLYVITATARYSDVPANLFILNQSVTHLGNSASLTCYIFHLFYWNWEATYCFFTFTLFSSLGSLCLLTINRFLSIMSPLKYPRRMTPFRAKVLVAFVWVAASILTSLHLVGYTVYNDANFFNYGRYYMMFLMVIFLSSNLYMFCKSQIHARKIKKSFQGVVTGLQRDFKEDLKSVKTIAMVGATFLMAWLPLMAVFFVYGSHKEDMHFQRYTAFISPFIALNIISDPLIYYVRSPEFQMFYQRWKGRHGLGTSRVQVDDAMAKGITHEGFVRDTTV